MTAWKCRPIVITPLLLACIVGCNGAPVATSPLERGAVAAPEVQAAEVGAEMLRRGGNAVDAAIAVQFAISVTNAVGAGLGGGGFMLIHEPDAEGVEAHRQGAQEDGRQVAQDQGGQRRGRVITCEWS
jgi:gamma-glutamyltranspeptidase/glutathione hydrolase